MTKNQDFVRFNEYFGSQAVSLFCNGGKAVANSDYISIVISILILEKTTYVRVVHLGENYLRETCKNTVEQTVGKPHSVLMATLALILEKTTYI